MYAAVHLRLGDALSGRVQKHMLTPAATVALWLRSALAERRVALRAAAATEGREGGEGGGPADAKVVLFVAAQPHEQYLGLLRSIASASPSPLAHRTMDRTADTSPSPFDVVEFDRGWLRRALANESSGGASGGGASGESSSAVAVSVLSALYGSGGDDGDDEAALLRDQRLMFVERLVGALAPDFQAAFPGASTFGDGIAFLRRADRLTKGALPIKSRATDYDRVS